MFKSLPGFRNFYPEDCSVRNHIFNIWRQSSRVFGFQEYSAPLLEPLELFTQKSGEEIASQLFNFEDKGGRKVALRPEMTPSLARLVGSKVNAMRKPIKWFNIGEHFRYERPQKGRLRSFYQLNCDILGEPSLAADAEAIALLIKSLTGFGLSEQEFCVHLSDRDLWTFFLQGWHLNTNQIEQTLLVIDKLEKESEEKVKEKLRPIFQKKTDCFFKEASQLAHCQGLDHLKDFFTKQRFSEASLSNIAHRIEDWKILLHTLDSLNLLQFIKIDLSVVRGLAYYTGFVFEAFQIVGNGRSLGGGGRYDYLVKKLGGPEICAVGFAMGDVTLKDLLEHLRLLPNYIDSPQFFAIIDQEHAVKEALSDVTLIRSLGYSVEYVLKPTKFGKQIKLANQLHAHYALIYGQTEIESGQLKVKDLMKGKEVCLPRNNLTDFLKDLSHNGTLPIK